MYMSRHSFVTKFLQEISLIIINLIFCLNSYVYELICTMEFMKSNNTSITNLLRRDLALARKSC